MVETFAVSFFSVLLAYLGRYNQRYLRLSFLLITIFLSLGYEWGNDVPTYQIFYDKYINSGISIFDITGLIYLNEKEEFGWVLLNILSKPIGFYGFRAVLFCLENYIIYRLVSRKVAKKWYWLAVFIYTFNPNYMIISSSMMRQWLAICIVVFAFEFIEKKKIIPYIIFVLIAYTIHRSSLICLPFVVFPYLHFKFSRQNNVIILFFLLVYYVLSQVVVEEIVSFINSEDIYTRYTTSEYSSGVGIVAIFIGIIYMSLLLFVEDVDYTNKIYIVLPSLFVLILPLYSYSGLASRLSFYLTIFSIASFPIFVRSTNASDLIKQAMIGSVMAYTLYCSWIFWTDLTWLVSYGNYRLIF